MVSRRNWLWRLYRALSPVDRIVEIYTEYGPWHGVINTEVATLFLLFVPPM